MSQSAWKNLLAHRYQRPLGRRDFLAHGLVSMSAYAFLPSFITSLSQQARADESCTLAPQGSSLFPFLVFDMAGGGGLPANFLVGKQGGPQDYLSSYNLLGWNPKTQGIDARFGLPMPAGNIGKIFQGMTTTMSAEAQARTRLTSLCHQSQDDTSSNTTSPMLLASLAGLQGSMVQTGLGMVNSISGGNTSVPEKLNNLKPLFVGSVNDLTSATGYGVLSTQLPIDPIRAIAKANLKLSESQAKKFSNFSNSEQFKQLVKCGYLKNQGLVEGASDVDPRRNPQAVAAFGINANSEASSEIVRVASVALSAIGGTSGPGCITLGGCDYHDGSQTTGDGKDLTMGQWIGRSVELAHRLQKPLFFALITDGGVIADPGTRNWRSDAGDKSMSVVGMYQPSGAREIRKMQIGHYSDGQGAERQTIIGASTSNVAYSIFANYLNVNGKVGEFEKIVPAANFAAANIDKVLTFA